MTNPAVSRDQPSPVGSSPEPRDRLGYLLKHAQRRLAQLYACELAAYGVDATQWVVLLTLAAGDPPSQQDLARRLGIDRTTMVTLLDALETQGLLARRPDPADRRRNIIGLTTTGRDTLDRATEAADRAERRFLSPLGDQQAHQLSQALQAILAAGVDITGRDVDSAQR